MRAEEYLKQSLLQWKAWKKINESACNALPSVEKELGNGLVNHSFLVRSGDYRAVIRVNCADPDKLGINRSRELKILSALEYADFVPDILYSDTHVLVTEYISGMSLDTRSLSSSVIRSRLSSLIERIQATCISGMNRFSYLDCCKGYARALPYNPSEVVDWEKLCSVAAELDTACYEPVLCHHDLGLENIIIRREAIFFIDWEFGALGHPAFDYVKLFGENIPKSNVAHKDISSGAIQQIKFLQSAMDDLWFAVKKIAEGQAKSGAHNDRKV